MQRSDDSQVTEGAVQGLKGEAARALLAGLAGAGLAGGALGLLDAALTLRGAQIEGLALARLLAVGALAGILAGAVAGVVLLPLWRAARGRPWARRLLAGGGLAGLAAGIVDGTVWVGLYPEAHLLAGLAAVAGVAAAGAAWWPARGAAAAAPVIALTAGASWLGPALLGEGLHLWQVVADHGALTRRVAGLWAAPERAAVGGCVWPEAVVPPAGGRLTGAPVILLTVDAWRFDEGLAALPRTAARLQGRAVAFERAYAPANRTTETMYSVLTGRWPHHLRFTPTLVDAEDRPVDQAPEPSLADPRSWSARSLAPLQDAQPTLPVWLKAAGYTSATVVAYLFLRAHLGVTRDFAVVDDGPYATANRDREGITSGLSLAAARAFLEGAPDRFFLWIHWMDPHEPYHGFGEVGAEAPPRDRYRAELRRVDAALEELLADLEARGILGRAVVILTADHGEAFGEHGDRFHGTSVFEEQVRVPLWVAAPGITPGAVETPVSLVDLAPTLADLLGLEGVPALDGRSLAPALFGEALADRPVLTRSSRGGYRYAVVAGRWKLVVDFTRRATALFDLEADPGERQSLVDAEPAVRDRLLCLLEAAGPVR